MNQKKVGIITGVCKRKPLPGLVERKDVKEIAIFNIAIFNIRRDVKY